MNHPIAAILAACALAAAIQSPVRAQMQINPDEVFAKGTALLQQGDYEGAYTEFNKMADVLGPKAEKDFGPRFGTVYYHRGLALMGAGKFAEAASDFEASATRFANKPGEQRVNPYHTVSFLQCGAAHLKVKEPDYTKVLEFLKKFETIMQGQPIDRDNVIYNRAALWSGLATAEAKTDKPRNAEATFEKIVKDPGGPDRASRSTYEINQQSLQQLAVDIVDSYSRGKNYKDGKAFLTKYRNVILGDVALSYFFAPRYLQMAADAAKYREYDFALALYGTLPNSKEVAAAIERAERSKDATPLPNGKPSAYGALVKQIKDQLAKDIATGKPIEVFALDGNARIYQSNGNYQASYGIYRSLARLYPKSTLRPEILYFAALSASVVGKLDDTQKYGETFMKEFPNHELRPRVEELMVEGMFWAQRYEDALRIARAARPTLADGSPGAELCDFVIGGSLYFLGQYAEAEPILRAFIEKYPKSKHRELARYYNADNLARLNKFTDAGTQLDEFLRDYPDSQVLDLALYARANAHYNLDQMDGAVSRLNQFITQRPYSMVRDQANNLFGNVFESQKKFDEAEKSYLKAKEIAQEAGHDGVAAESLVFLMNLLVTSKERDADTVAHYDEFFSKYPESMNRAKAATAALQALERKNRLPDAMKRLEEIIAAFGNNIEAVGLEDCIVAYVANAEKAGMTVPQLRDRLYNFPGLPSDADIAKIRLRMALADLYEKKQKEEKNEEVRARMKGEIDGLFNQLKRDFDISRMSNYTLVRIGDYLVKAGQGGQARDYFAQVLKNADTKFRDKAMFNLAALNGESDNKADRAKAIELLDEVLRDFPNDRFLGERAVRQKAIVYELDGDWEKVSEIWRQYLTNQAWTKYQTEAYYMIGVSQEKRKLWDDALRNYLRVFSLDAPNLLYSSPAWFRFCEIQYKEMSRRQEGYEALHRMVKEIGHLEEAEAKSLSGEWQTMLDPLSRRRLAERLQVNYIQRAIQTKTAWENAGGINIIKPEPEGKKR